jgi:hypothetical protein
MEKPSNNIDKFNGDRNTDIEKITSDNKIPLLQVEYDIILKRLEGFGLTPIETTDLINGNISESLSEWGLGIPELDYRENIKKVKALLSDMRQSIIVPNSSVDYPYATIGSQLLIELDNIKSIAVLTGYITEPFDDKYNEIDGVEIAKITDPLGKALFGKKIGDTALLQTDTSNNDPIYTVRILAMEQME